ncbi:flagellar protein FlaG [Salinimonas sp. HHU 13199]|uniref:Flagellar protein FlaG n=1 Tax=Salinimonas profundi TaxID=2729140 RepID=A0ABR8LJS9_9ALTE|nr:flagellar protein FlaG [Salinimonas profundi]MBD3585351.1 flagellar protein FlaG [Salinimonas profundi]
MAVNNLSDIKSYSSTQGDSQLSAKVNLDVEANIKASKAETEKKDSVTSTVSTSSDDASQMQNNAEPDSQAILERLSTINEQFPLKATSLVFEFDDTNDPPVIKVVDKESGDVIRELPPKELREIAKALSDIADSLKEQAHNLHDEQEIHASGIFINERL